MMVLAMTYEAACRDAFVKHLKAQHMDETEMVHQKCKSIIEEQGFLSTIKIGDWVDVLVVSAYSPSRAEFRRWHRLRAWVAH
jgi:hypothetical protein